MKLIIANLKMNLTKEETINYLEKISNIDTKDNKIIICPSTLYLSLNDKYKYILGCQNISINKEGSYTGQVSINQVKSLDIKYTLVHHSEVCTYLNETTKEANAKLKHILDNNLIPIVCVGETKLDKDNNKSYEAITKTLDEIFKNIDTTKEIIIAYEPIYAIGTNNTPSIEDITNMIKYIRKYFLYKNNISLIYGGSINNSNINQILNINQLDGLIIGNYITNINNLINVINII